jgi:twitching motility protein PilJ
MLAEDDTFQDIIQDRMNQTLWDDALSSLQYELNIRKLEFATLVDNNSRIIVGANANRTGEFFDPSGIVTE